jgi:hypothetical protein
MLIQEETPPTTPEGGDQDNQPLGGSGVADDLEGLLATGV